MQDFCAILQKALPTEVCQYSHLSNVISIYTQAVTKGLNTRTVQNHSKIPFSLPLTCLKNMVALL